MPQYTYRREDGSTFSIRQKFSDEPLTVDPDTGQQVSRVMHAAGVIFKGSGFYINDSKGATSSSAPPKSDTSESKTETTKETAKESSKEAAPVAAKADSAAD